jgi:hypothetical protein
MKVLAEEEAIKKFTTVNGLTFTTEEDLQKYFRKVGLEQFIQEYWKACPCEINFVCEGWKDSDKLFELYKSKGGFPNFGKV